ncbi:MAG: hypothetical protein JKY54_05715 [Flavobacteriales bacterium]|nr:hypothetical protein [Flavobacteriales bacterium]
MRKTIIIIISLLTFVQVVLGQEKISFNDIEAREFVDSFLSFVENQEYEKAYLMLDDEFKERQSRSEFTLYFKNVLSYYGKIKNHKCSLGRDNCFREVVGSYMAGYSIEYEKTKAELMFMLRYDSTGSLKLDYRIFFLERKYIPISGFDKMCETALKRLTEKDYQTLFDLVDGIYYPFEKFKKNIKKLEVNDQINYRQKGHDIRVYDDEVQIEIRYEINEIGDIIFVYTKENEIIKFTGIRFYFTKEIQDKYNANFSLFIDTTSLLNDKVLLSAKDSLVLKKEFDRIEDEIFEAKLKNILDGDLLSLPDNKLLISTAYDWNQLEKSDQKLISESSEKYLIKLVENDLEGFWELCHSKFKKTTSLVAFQDFGKLISNLLGSMSNLDFIDAKKVVYSQAPAMSRFSTGGSADKTDPTYLQFYTLPDIDIQVLSIYRLNSSPLAKTITMKFGLEKAMYRLLSIEINTSAINKKDANYYIDISNKWKSKKSAFPQFTTLNMAYRLSYLGKGTSTNAMIKITEDLQAFQQNPEFINEIKTWNINNSTYDIISVDFLETQNDITPNIN